MSIFKACDIRGRYGADLMVGHAEALGRAIVSYARPPTVLVGGDGRLSTPSLKGALIEALLAAGADVVDIGQVPTPAFYFARRRLGIAHGVMVTASHNPAEDNGFKITLGDLPITEDELSAIAEAMHEPEVGAPPVRGKLMPSPILEDYADFAVQIGQDAGIQPGTRLVLDCANGMMALVAPRVFARLSIPCQVLFGEVDGRFPGHPPNPSVVANLAALRDAVATSGASLGVAFDGDGDRAVFVDETGEPLDCDRAIVLFAQDVLRRSPGGMIVYDQKSSDVVREEVHRAGGRPRMQRSGYAFIKTSLLTEGAAYAGEASGHHFFADVGGDDGLVAALRMLAIVQASGQPLSRLAASLPAYASTPDLRIPLAPEELAGVLDALREGLRGRAEISELDGVRAQFAFGWGLARPSVTEPVLTVRLEGRTQEDLERVREEFHRAAPALRGRI